MNLLPWWQPSLDLMNRCQLVSENPFHALSYQEYFMESWVLSWCYFSWKWTALIFLLHLFAGEYGWDWVTSQETFCWPAALACILSSEGCPSSSNWSCDSVGQTSLFAWTGKLQICICLIYVPPLVLTLGIWERGCVVSCVTIWK